MLLNLNKILLLGFWAGLMAVIVLTIISAETTRNDHKAEIQRTCDKAHNEINGASEEACGRLQDKYNIIYKCGAGGGYCYTTERK